MPHDISIGNHANLVVMRTYGSVKDDDIITDPAEIHLNEDRPIYLLVDTGDLHVSLPSGFTRRLRNSILQHPNLAHLAIYAPSSMMRSIMQLTADLTRQHSKISVHDSLEKAEAHLMDLIHKAGL